MDTLDHALAALRDHEPGTIVGLTYHPDADPGDGSGWCCEVGDLHTYGQRDEAVATMLARLGVAETVDAPAVTTTAEVADRWMTWDDCEGWTDHGTEAAAREHHEACLQDKRDEAADGWSEDVERYGVWRLVPVVTVALVQTATSEDDTDEGELCRAAGWDYIAEAAETEHADPIARLTAERDQAIAQRDALAVVVRRVAEACDECQRIADADVYDTAMQQRLALGRAVVPSGVTWSAAAAALRALLPSEVSDAG